MQGDRGDEDGIAIWISFSLNKLPNVKQENYQTIVSNKILKMAIIRGKEAF